MHFSSSVRDLGFILDSVLTLSHHVNSVSGSGFYYLHQLCLILKTLPLLAIATLVRALICAKIDYDNVVYTGHFQQIHVSLKPYLMLLPAS